MTDTQLHAPPGPAFAVVDTETTGLRTDDRVIEIGVVLLSAELTVEGEWHTLVNPEREMDASWVHKIEAHHVRYAPTFAEAAPEFFAVVHGRVLIAHNYAFDHRMLKGDAARAGLPAPPGGLCTMRLAGGLSLAKACVLHEIERSVSHEALADAHAAAALFRRVWPQVGNAERAQQLRRTDPVVAPPHVGPSVVHTRSDALARVD